MNLGFIILAHHQPEAIRKQVDVLAGPGDRVVIHFDTSATKADRQAVDTIAAEKPGQVKVISKVHCVWGEWSLVDAVLHALREFEKMPDPPEYIHLMSGADFPIRPMGELKEFLKRNRNRDFIECCDLSKKSWVKGGLGTERLRFYYPFNFRTSRRSFDRMVRWQRKLKIRRRMPGDLKPHMGSQWWTLRWTTCKKVLDFTKENPAVPKFFKSTWIPDESYFQTVIAKIIPRGQIADLQLMFHHLTPAGRPYVFYNDHLSLLKRLPHFFVRKVSPDAAEMIGYLHQPEGLAGRRIPKPEALAKVRDLIQSRIDENHLFTTGVPGYYQDKVQTTLRQDKADKAEQKTADSLPRQLIVRPGITRPVVVLFPEDLTRLDWIQSAVESNAGSCWLGEPFYSGKIMVPPAHLERMGMTRKSHLIRNDFNRQFSRYLIEATPAGLIPVFVIFPTKPKPDLEVLEGIERLVPLLVRSAASRAHSVSRTKASLFEMSPKLAGRTVEVHEAELPTMLEDLRDACFSGEW